MGDPLGYTTTKLSLGHTRNMTWLHDRINLQIKGHIPLMYPTSLATRPKGRKKGTRQIENSKTSNNIFKERKEIAKGRK